MNAEDRKRVASGRGRAVGHRQSTAIEGASSSSSSPPPPRYVRQPPAARTVSAASTILSTSANSLGHRQAAPLSEQLNLAFARLSEMVASGTNNIAITMDIDDTVCTLDSSGAVVPKPEMLKFYTDVGTKLPTVSRFFITARPVGKDGANASFTKRELNSMGFDNFDGLFCFPEELYTDENPSDRIGRFKECIRSFLATTGYILAYNFGDQDWDHCGHSHIESVRVSGKEAVRF